MKQNTKPINEEVFGAGPDVIEDNGPCTAGPDEPVISVAETKESEPVKTWEKEFDKEICKEYLEYGYKAYVSLVKDFITKALSQRELEVLENLKPKNIKADYYQVNYFKDNRTVFQTPVNNLIKNE